MKRLLSVPFVASVLFVLSVSSSANVFNLGPGLTNLETVTVGDPGNAPDGSGGHGAVAYSYNTSKYEVTTGQYAAFLNAVAATDTYGLYNYNGRIGRSGAPGSYAYSVAADVVNRPVEYVSFWDAVRFANWLHNSQPTGPQNASTTEDGAYFINGYNGTDGQTIQRKPGAKWFIPSEDEWYKAAYYKGSGTNAGYWNYPTRSDTPPGRDMADANGNNANYYTSSGPYPIDNGQYTTIVGEFQNSASSYGTFDQGGNVWEWNEAIIGGLYRGNRGGSYYLKVGLLGANSRGNMFPTYEANGEGFRVAAAIPEPSSLLVLGSGILALAGIIRRRNGLP